MEVTHFFKNLSPKEEKVFVDYVKEKMHSFENLLTKFADDAKILKVSIEKYEKHDAYEVEFALILPQKSLIAKETSHQITKAIDLSKDRLLAQIRKHMDHLRHDRAHGSIRKTEKAKTEVEQFIES